MQIFKSVRTEKTLLSYYISMKKQPVCVTQMFKSLGTENTVLSYFKGAHYSSTEAS
jgi:hypothetical protein